MHCILKVFEALQYVTNTCRIDIFGLLVKETFRQPDFADTFLQFRKIVHRTAALEPLIIQRKTFDDIFPEPLGCPDAESRSLLRFDPVAD